MTSAAVGPGEAAAAAAPTSGAGYPPFPRNLADFEAQLKAPPKPIDRRKAAALINKFRPNPARPGSGLAQLSARQVATWEREVMGMSRAERKRRRDVVFLSELPYPTSSSVVNGIIYCAVPFIDMSAKGHAITALLVAGLSPIAVAAIQVMTNKAAEVYRQKNSMATKVDKSRIHAKLTPSQMLEEQESALAALHANNDRLDAFVTDMAAKHGVSFAEPRGADAFDDATRAALHEIVPATRHARLRQALRAAADDEDSTALRALVDGLPDGDRDRADKVVADALGRHYQGRMDELAGKLSKEELLELTGLFVDNASHELRIHELTEGLDMSKELRDRNLVYTGWQGPARILRAGSGVAKTLLRQPGKSAPASWLDGWWPARRLPLGAAKGIAAGVAGAALVTQHVLCGFDGVNAFHRDNRMNIERGDLFNEAGHLAWARGERATEDFFDEEKMHAMWPREVVQMRDRTVKLVEGWLERMEAQAHVLADADAGAGAPAADGADLESGGEHPSPKARRLAARIAEYRNDLALLKSGDVTELTQGGDVRRILDDIMAGTSWRHALREGWNALTPEEYSAQIGQRYTQAFMGGVFGAVGAAAAGPVLSWLLGGDGIQLSTELYIGLGGAALGAVSAYTQSMAVDGKNQRRDGGTMGLGGQLLNGLVQPAVAAKQRLDIHWGRPAAAARSRQAATVAGSRLQSAVGQAIDKRLDAVAARNRAPADDAPAAGGTAPQPPREAPGAADPDAITARRSGQ
ncbi:MAG: hypothetical protein ACTHL8_01660 [Burkholderiaceae bacterium]